MHEDYETHMLDSNRTKLVQAVNAKLNGQRVTGAELYTTGPEAADHIVQLMGFVIRHLKPEDIITVWKNAQGPNRSEKMWNALGDKTSDCIVAGARALAAFWESAWREGRKGHPALPSSKIESVSRTTLMLKYKNSKLFESNWLKDMHLP